MNTIFICYFTEKHKKKFFLSENRGKLLLYAIKKEKPAQNASFSQRIEVIV